MVPVLGQNHPEQMAQEPGPAHTPQQGSRRPSLWCALPSSVPASTLWRAVALAGARSGWQGTGADKWERTQAVCVRTKFRAGPAAVTFAQD